MSDYSQLVSDISQWVARGDLGTVIPGFISLAEDSFSQLVRILEMEEDAVITTSNGQAPLPPGFLGFKSVEVQNSPYGTATLVSGDQLRRMRRGGELVNGDTPFAIESNRLKTISGDPLSFEVTYFRRLERITADNPSNALLDIAFNVYLFGSISQTYKFLIEEEKADIYAQRTTGAIDALHRADMKKRTGTGPLVRRLEG